MPLHGERERDAAAPRAHVRRYPTPPDTPFHVPRPTWHAARPVQHQLDQALRLGAGNQGAPVEAQLEPAEARAADRVRKRDAARTSVRRHAEPLRQRRIGLPLASQPDVARAHTGAGHGGPEPRRLATRVRHTGALQALGSFRQHVRDRTAPRRLLTH